MIATADDRPARQLLIGLDAMEWDLVRRWAGEGKLPTFGRLLARGLGAELSTTSAQLPDTVWASIYTGVNPAKYEKYFYIQYDPATMGLRNVPDDAIRATPFWDYLSAAGLRVGVLDVPKFPLSASLHGFQLTNWGAHATKTARASFPPELLDQVDARFGPHPVGDCDATDCKPQPLQGLKARVLAGVARHGELFRWQMQTQAWDVFFAAFSAPHCIGHHFWHWLDPTHPRHGEQDTHGLSDAIESAYRAIDAEIGKMLAVAGEDTRVLIFAGHGMGPIYHASWNLPEILDLLGYGEGPAASASGRDAGPEATPRAARVNPWRRLKMLVPGRVQYAIKAMLPKRLQDELLFRWYAGGHRWAGRRAFSVPNNDSVGAIRVSLRGRDRGGVVESLDEYRRICRDIADALEELTDPATGRKVVRQVTLTHQLFHGPYLDGLPDLTVLWEQSFPWSAIHSPRFGTLRLRQQDGRTGSHTPHGFLLAAGPGVAPGQVSGRSIYDIAPTVLQASGVPIPSHMDGTPIPLAAGAPLQTA